MALVKKLQPGGITPTNNASDNTFDQAAEQWMKPVKKGSQSTFLSEIAPLRQIYKEKGLAGLKEAFEFDPVAKTYTVKDDALQGYSGLGKGEEERANILGLHNFKKPEEARTYIMSKVYDTFFNTPTQAENTTPATYTAPAGSYKQSPMEIGTAIIKNSFHGDENLAGPGLAAKSNEERKALIKEQANKSISEYLADYEINKGIKERDYSDVGAAKEIQELLKQPNFDEKKFTELGYKIGWDIPKLLMSDEDQAKWDKKVADEATAKITKVTEETKAAEIKQYFNTLTSIGVSPDIIKNLSDRGFSKISNDFKAKDAPWFADYLTKHPEIQVLSNDAGKHRIINKTGPFDLDIPGVGRWENTAEGVKFYTTPTTSARTPVVSSTTKKLNINDFSLDYLKKYPELTNLPAETRASEVKTAYNLIKIREGIVKRQEEDTKKKDQNRALYRYQKSAKLAPPYRIPIWGGYKEGGILKGGLGLTTPKPLSIPKMTSITSKVGGVTRLSFPKLMPESLLTVSPAAKLPTTLSLPSPTAGSIGGTSNKILDFINSTTKGIGKGVGKGLTTAANFVTENPDVIATGVDAILTAKANTENARLQKESILTSLVKPELIQKPNFRVNYTVNPEVTLGAAKYEQQGKRFAESTTDLNRGFLARLGSLDKATQLRVQGSAEAQARLDAQTNQKLESDYRVDSTNAQTIAKTNNYNKSLLAKIPLVDVNKNMADLQSSKLLGQKAADVVARMKYLSGMRGLMNEYQDPNLKISSDSLTNLKGAIGNEDKAIIEGAGLTKEYAEFAVKNAGGSGKFWDEGRTNLYKAKLEKDTKALNDIMISLNSRYNMFNMGLGLTRSNQRDGQPTFYQDGTPVQQYASGGSLSEKAELQRQKAEDEVALEKLRQYYKRLLQSEEFLQKAMIKIFK